MSGASQRVSVERANPAARATLERLLQLYVHDFSELYAPEEWTIGADGRFDYPYLESYWSEPDRVPLLIRAGDRLAGFALVNRHSWRGAPIDHALAEFFVLRQHRRAGVGRRAAQILMRRYPGRWELAIAKPNAAAHAFWPRTVLETPGVEKLTMWKIEDRERTILDFEVNA